MVTVGDLHMHVDDLGVPVGQPLVMLHGFTGVGRREWQAQIDAFTDKFRVIVPDLRGHGGTDNPAGREAMNHRQFAADVAGLCDALQISRAVFVGESTGSMLQLSLLLQRPTSWLAPGFRKQAPRPNSAPVTPPWDRTTGAR